MISTAIRHPDLMERSTERFDEYRVVATGEMRASSLRDHLLALANVIRQHLPTRDNCAISIEHAGNLIAFDIADQLHAERVIAQLDCDDLDTYDTTIDLSITKTVSGEVLSVYAIDAFGDYLSTGSIKDVVAALSSRFTGALFFECQAEVIVGGTRTIRLIPQGTVPIVDRLDTRDREQMLALFRESAHTDLKVAPLVPEDVAFREATGVEAIDGFLRRLAALVSTSFLANHSWMELDQLHYRVIGYKVIEGADQLEELGLAHEGLVKIARWCYASGGQSDKVGLARNVMSIYLTRLGDLAARLDVWHAIQSNYQIYLKQNIESYLALKGRLSDMLMDASERTQSLAGTVLDALRNGIYVLLTFLVTVVVVNAVKDTSVDAVFSVSYLIIATITCLVLSIWVGAAAWQAVREYDSGAASLRELVAETFGTMLSPQEMANALDPAAKRNRRYLVSHARQHVATWIIIAAVLLIGLAGAHVWVEAQKPAKGPSIAKPAAITPIVASRPETQEAAPKSIKGFAADAGTQAATPQPASAPRSTAPAAATSNPAQPIHQP
ncbi:hypothetical protein CS053_10105 [Rhodanobacter glycinis]|uniref:Uncharacterized protein n=1 Tax=Rhodanobacter glycinis TaxID=582702 RepID=A0A5B9E2B5_9GAMM|nr:hypothetical protein [Rhodanobacter glycinis]QEE24811.1 hypothetical protein CS053_10105 [Rhodanobacter glycinis]